MECQRNLDMLLWNLLLRVDYIFWHACVLYCTLLRDLLYIMSWSIWIWLAFWYLVNCIMPANLLAFFFEISLVVKLIAKFFAKFICYKFFKNFNYSNFKKIFKIFKLYISKYSKIYALQKFFKKFYSKL